MNAGETAAWADSVWNLGTPHPWLMFQLLLILKVRRIKEKVFYRKPKHVAETVG